MYCAESQLPQLRIGPKARDGIDAPPFPRYRGERWPIRYCRLYSSGEGHLMETAERNCQDTRPNLLAIWEKIAAMELRTLFRDP